MSIGTNLKALREERKLTQDRVAEALGVTFQAVSSWERDEYKPDTDKLIKLRKRGIKISLDDFGTGYSSLSYLMKMPIDTLKIDKSFVDSALSDDSTHIIIESILNMSSNMGFESIAEGVESEQQYNYLNDIGCDVIQGFYMGKPLPAIEIEKILDSKTEV